MIISHQHRYIFAAIPKTGTHSVRRALRLHLGADDLEQVGLFVQKRFPFAEFADIRHGHISLQQIRPCLEQGQFDRYYKFAFVRNPYDRFVSYCAFMTRETGQFATDATGFMKHVLFQVRPEDHVLFQPQHSFLVDENGESLSDFVGRVEEMQSGYDAVCRHIGLPGARLEVVNASTRGDYRRYYDDELRQGVREYYRRDFELFGYSID